jgi:hypothetical protein
MVVNQQSPRLDRMSSVRHNDGVEYAGLSWTAGARKHRVSRAQVRHVIDHAGLFFVQPATPPDRPDDAVLFLGDDEVGSPVEVVGVELADGRLRVIHAMPMRSGYQDLYEEAKKWRQ